MLRRSLHHKPHLAACQPSFHSRRLLSTSPKPQLADSAILVAHDIFQNAHHLTGTSWSFTLPAVAVALRFLVLAPITFYTHNVTAKRLKLLPLGYALRHAIRKDVIRKHGAEGPRTCDAIVRKTLARKGRGLRKEFGVQYWKSFLGWVQVPVWLTMIEALRRMCGTREGLLGLAQRGFGSVTEKGMGVDNTIEGDAVEDVEAVEKGTDMAEALPQAVYNVPVEASFATEGMLWFPNLLVPDPHALLSVFLTASIWANVAYLQHKNQRVNAEPSKWRERFTRTLYVVGAGAGAATVQLPSAMLVYWVSSSASALLFNVVLDRTRPLPKPIIPRTVKPFEIRHKVESKES